jgi:hypothetical protein
MAGRGGVPVRAVVKPAPPTDVGGVRRQDKNNCKNDNVEPAHP